MSTSGPIFNDVKKKQQQKSAEQRLGLLYAVRQAQV